MSGELQLSVSHRLSNGPLKRTIAPGGLSIDQSSPGIGGSCPTIGTTEEAISFGEITTEGRALVTNLDPNNDVEIGPQVGTGNAQLCILLKPGEPNAIRLKPGVNWRGKALTAPCKVDFVVFEN